MRVGPVLVIALLFLVSCSKQPAGADHATDTTPTDDTDATAQMVECPVCGLRFPKKEARGTADYKGRHFFFLLPDHKNAFETAPETYLK